MPTRPLECLLLLSCLVGCHHGAGAHPPSPPTHTPYLALFDRGHSWKLGAVACHVAEVKPVGDATVSRLACDPPNAGLLIVGTWVATPAGLYHPLVPVDDPDELTLLGEDDLLLTANATEHNHEHVIEGAHISNEAFEFGGSWCVRESTTFGAESRSFTLCLDASGITGGGETIVTNGAKQETYFGAVPRDDD